MKNVGNSSRGRSQGFPKIFRAPMLVICDHIGWNSLKLISRLISVGFLLSVDPNIMDLLRREHFQNWTNP